MGVKPTGWIVTGPNGRVLHFSAHEGWTVDVVTESPDAEAGNGALDMTDEMRNALLAANAQPIDHTKAWARSEDAVLADYGFARATDAPRSPPREPTLEMIEAGSKWSGLPVATWRAMYAAAPAAVALEQDVLGGKEAGLEADRETKPSRNAGSCRDDARAPELTANGDARACGSNPPPAPAAGAPEAALTEYEAIVTAELRRAGCSCPLPLLGYLSGVGPRCRLCNVQAGRAAPAEAPQGDQPERADILKSLRSPFNACMFRGDCIARIESDAARIRALEAENAELRGRSIRRKAELIVSRERERALREALRAHNIGFSYDSQAGLVRDLRSLPIEDANG